MQSANPQSNWSKVKQARIAALRRQRRVIFNDDSEELMHEGANTIEGFLAPRLKPLVDTQVDTIAWSVLGNWGDAPSYDSKIQPMLPLMTVRFNPFMGMRKAGPRRTINLMLLI